jgi:catalase
MVMWLMSDRALPRSYRMMEGFGVHTFRLVNARRESVFVKFHWKPLLGAHSILWDEAQKISGKDPDFHRRDLWEAIEAGNYPEYELGLQIIEEEDQLAFGFDLLDATKLVPEEVVPVRRVGKLTLDRNPQNFFAETEQVAYCVGNIVPGIDFSNDPLLHARLFSYLDTQLLRLGGPNFTELPINRPVVEVNNHQQDGLGRHRIHTSRALYHPNSIEANRPWPAEPERGFVHLSDVVEGVKRRERSPTFNDHFSQARMFLRSQSPAERAHLIQACQFELGKVERLAIRERVVALFGGIDEDLALEVAAGIGVTRIRSPSQPSIARPTATPPPSSSEPIDGEETSPALSLMQQPRRTIRTRRVALLVSSGVRDEDVQEVESALLAQGATVDLVGIALGAVKTDAGRPLDVQKSFLTTASVLYDALFIPGGKGASVLAQEEGAREFVRDAFLHGKAIGCSREGLDLLHASLNGDDLDLERAPIQGVVTLLEGTDQTLQAFAEEFIGAIAQHRFFDRPRLRSASLHEEIRR